MKPTRVLLAVICTALFCSELFGQVMITTTGRVYRYDPSPNEIKEWITSGKICEAVGHKWESGCGMAGCLVYHKGPMRHCVVCGKVEHQTVGPWE